VRILLLGAGAVGGYFGGRLAEAGSDVTFLVRAGRYDQLKANGIRIESVFGNADVPVQAITQPDLTASFDIIVLTCKAFDLASAVEAIAPAVGPDTAILPLLNGVAHIEQLNVRFGSDRVLGGVAKIAVTLAPDGVIQHLNDWRFITFGEQTGVLSDRAKALKAAFDQSSVVAKAVDNIMQIMWEKVVHLSTVAGMTCAMRASVGDIARTEGGTNLMLEFFERNAEIARREGFTPSSAFMAEYQQLFRNQSSTYKASMLRDIERNGPIEADHIIGFMFKKALYHKVDPELHRFVYAHLKSYEARRNGNVQARTSS
jgi:2-dehydropantoate 2-reductase